MRLRSFSNKHRVLLLIMLSILIVATGFLTLDHQPSVPRSKQAANMTAIALGEFTPASDPYQGLMNYMKTTDTKPAIHMWFNSINAPFPTTTVNKITALNVLPEISIDPAPYSAKKCRKYATLYAHKPDDNPCSHLYIINGHMDAVLARYAYAATAWGKPVLYRLGAEMNGNWNQYGVDQNGNTATSFVRMWQHIVQLFRHDGATNVRWVWAPNIIASGVANFTNFYPGDANVDWVALDGYNFGTTRPTSSWQSFDTIYRQSYQKMVKLTNKPIMLAEISSAEQGGNKAEWINEAFFRSIPTYYPRIRSVVWFNIDKRAYGETDWRINSSKGTLAIYKKVVQSPLYQGQLT